MRGSLTVTAVRVSHTRPLRAGRAPVASGARRATGKSCRRPIGYVGALRQCREEFPKKRRAGERGVSLVPDVVRRLKSKQIDVLVQARAGEGALIPDEAFREAGA